MSTRTRTQVTEIADLQEQVQSRLLGVVHDLRFILQGDGLVIRGRSRTYYGKQLAQQAVLEAAKAPILANQIEVM